MSKAPQLSQSYSSPRVFSNTANMQSSRPSLGRVLELVSGSRYIVSSTDDGAGLLLANSLYANFIGSEPITASTFKELAAVDLISGASYTVYEFFAGSKQGGGDFVYDSSADKADHDAVTIIDPTVVSLWDGSRSDFSTLFTPGAGAGCFVRKNFTSINPSWAGCAQDNLTDDTEPFRQIRTVCEDNGYQIEAQLGTFFTVDSIDRIHAVKRLGSASIRRGTDTFYFEQYSAQQNTLYVNSATGDDNNDGITSSQPFLTIQAAIDAYAFYALDAQGEWLIKLAAGTFTEGAIADVLFSPSQLIIEGELSAGVPNVFLDGTTATNINGLNFNFCNRVRVRYINFSNWSRDGVVFQNWTKGIIDTCDASSNAFADFDCNQSSGMGLRGVCNLGSGSENGLRYYQNSSGAVGDGVNAVNIGGAILSGIVSRDGSKVVCEDFVNIDNVTTTSASSAVRLIKDGYVELRTSTISNNRIGIFADSNSQFDHESGTLTFTSNNEDKRFIDGAVDRSIINTASSVPYYFRPSTGTPTGEAPSSNYDLVVDTNQTTGMQWLNSDQTINFDFNKTERLSFNGADNSIRLTAGAVELMRFRAAGIIPSTDNSIDLGTASLRWGTVYAATGSINTSDANLKQDVIEISEQEKLVAIKIKGLMRRYRFKDAVTTKGDEARRHFGILSQEVKAAFESEGLDAHKYGMFCYDEWDESVEHIPAVKLIDPETGDVTTTQESMDVVTEAGSRYGIRYDELLCFIIAAS